MKLHVPPNTLKIDLSQPPGCELLAPWPKEPVVLSIACRTSAFQEDAEEMASGIKQGARGYVRSCEIVDFDDEPSGDVVLTIGGLRRRYEGRPCVAWAQDTSSTTILEARKAASKYNEVFHVSPSVADMGYARHLPHAITSRKVFRPTLTEKVMEIAYVGPEKGSDRVMERLLEKLGNVKIVDHKDPYSRSRIMSECIVAVVSPTRAEVEQRVMPRGIVEAIASGTPVVTNSLDTVEDLKPYVRSASACDIVSVVQELMMSPVKRSRMVRDPKDSWSLWSMEFRGKEIGQIIREAARS